MFEFANVTADRERLTAFVKAVAELLSSTITQGRWQLTNPPQQTNLHLNQDLLPAARAALKEFNRQQHLQTLVAGINAASDADLQSHGLTRDQLRFKLANVVHWERRFRQRLGFGTLRRFIKAIDTLLDSAVDLIPGGKALKELKDASFDATEGDEG